MNTDTMNMKNYPVDPEPIVYGEGTSSRKTEYADPEREPVPDVIVVDAEEPSSYEDDSADRRKLITGAVITVLAVIWLYIMFLADFETVGKTGSDNREMRKSDISMSEILEEYPALRPDGLPGGGEGWQGEFDWYHSIAELPEVQQAVLDMRKPDAGDTGKSGYLESFPMEGAPNDEIKSLQYTVYGNSDNNGGTLKITAFYIEYDSRAAYRVTEEIWYDFDSIDTNDFMDYTKSADSYATIWHDATYHYRIEMMPEGGHAETDISKEDAVYHHSGLFGLIRDTYENS